MGEPEQILNLPFIFRSESARYKRCNRLSFAWARRPAYPAPEKIMKPHRTILPQLGLAALLAFAGMQTTWASDDHDHDVARRAREAGEVLPLKSVLERVERQYPGQVMEVELEREGGRWVYEIKLLRAGGALLKLEVDARDGTLLRSRQRGNTEHNEHRGEKR